MTEVATTNGSALAIRPEQENFNRQQVAALKKMNGWDDVPAAELSVFFHQAQRTGLDPFARQIYLIGRKNNRRGGRTDYTIQTSIDGMRLVADRTGRYAGSDRPRFTEDGGERCCEVTVWKIVGGQRVPFTGIAYESEYRQDYSPMWKKMPRTMLAKCAESQALRKAFPADLSGIYGSEEMDQAGPAVSAPEELGAEVNEDGEVLDSQPVVQDQAEPEAEAAEVEEAEVVEDPGPETTDPNTRVSNDRLRALRDAARELYGQDGIREVQKKIGKQLHLLSAGGADSLLDRLNVEINRQGEEGEDSGSGDIDLDENDIAEVESIAGGGSEPEAAQSRADRPARKSQVDLLKTLAVELRGEDGVAKLEGRIGKPLEELTRAEADDWIDALTPEEA